MNPYTLPLHYFCSVAGLVMVIGGIWLVAKEKIYVDRESKEVTTVELPFGIKMQTNIPALALFLLGFIPLIYPLYATSGTLEEVSLAGNVTGDDYPVGVYAVVASEVVNNSPGEFSLAVPELNGRLRDYKVIYVPSSVKVHEGRPDLKVAANGVLPVPSPDLYRTLEEDAFETQVDPEPEDF